MIYHTIYLLVATSLPQHETIYDQYLDAFREIVQHGEEATAATAYPNGSQPHFPFEIGVGMPLLVTALKCRHSNLRHKALSLLKQCLAIQGFYMVSQGSALVAKAIEIEEALSCDPVNRDHDKETRPLQYVSVCRQDPAAYSQSLDRKEETGGVNRDIRTDSSRRTGLSSDGMTRHRDDSALDRLARVVSLR